MLGLKRGIVKLADYDENWAETAEQTIRELKEIFGEAAADIQHVGSTSIKYIKAKPILDIAVAVRSFSDVLPLIPKLKENGFRYKTDNDNDAEMFFSCGDVIADTRTHHIHVVIHQSKEWTEYILFRDSLNSNPHWRLNYQNLKQELAEKYPDDRNAYTEGKAEFIRNVLARAEKDSILGKTVAVTVDRPLGSIHPEYKNIVYPVNYGYIKGMRVYILGVDEPVQEFTGTVIAIANRKSDIEDKLIAAPEGMVIYKPEIEHTLYFQEQYFDTAYTCLYEKTCGAVLHTVIDGKRLYLLIKNDSGHIGFSKGHVEFG